jgi:hypothetical protein
MILDNELPALERRGVETQAADRAGQSRRNGAAKVESGSSSSFSKIADEVNGKANAENPAAKQSVKEKATKDFHAWQDSDFGFGDFLDIINPLQHLPIVATIYRNMTGDQIGMVPRIIGGALWGRIGGFVAGLVNAAVEWFTGKDVGDHIYSAIRGGAGDATNNTAITRAVTPAVTSGEGSTAAGVGAQGQHSASVLPALDKPTDSPAASDVTEIKPLSSLSPAVPSAYLLAAHAANARDDTDSDRNSYDAARRQLRFTA